MEQLKRIREERGYLQKDVAKFLGIDRTTYVKYETGKSDPDTETLLELASFYDVSTDELLGFKKKRNAPVKIPVLGDVAAGIPIEAITDVEDFEEITPDMAASGEYVALRIHGDSMAPRMVDGDVVIVRLQEDADSGDIAVVFVDGESATCKKIKKLHDGIMLMSINPSYEPMFYSNKQIADLPVRIWGKVVELRAKF